MYKNAKRLVLRNKVHFLLKSLSEDDKFFVEKKELLHHFLNIAFGSTSVDYFVTESDRGILTWLNQCGFNVKSKTDEGWPVNVPKNLSLA